MRITKFVVERVKLPDSFDSAYRLLIQIRTDRGAEEARYLSFKDCRFDGRSLANGLEELAAWIRDEEKLDQQAIEPKRVHAYKYQEGVVLALDDITI